MLDSERYRGVADDMLRRASSAQTASERVSYLELAAGWRKLETEAAAFEAKTTPPASDTVIPFRPGPEARPLGTEPELDR